MTKKEFLILAREIQSEPDVIDGMICSEPGAKYHAYLAHLARKIGAKRVVELGTYIGETAKYIAELNPDCSVVAVDINPDAMRQLTQIEPILPNIKAFTDDSIHFAGLYDRTPIDLLYIDVNHDFSLTHMTYESWKGFVRPGGIIAIDDTHLDNETEKFNQYLKDAGVNLIDIPNIHATGFGLIVTEMSE